MRKVVAFVLAMVTLLTMLVLPVAAAETTGTGTYGTDWLKYGDVNADNEINAKDALAALKYAVGKQLFSDVEKKVADVNVDQEINAKDALDVLKYSVGKLLTFTAGVFYQITSTGGTTPEPDPPTPPVGDDYIAKYDKGNSVNGAYVVDTTADTSFKLDVSSLPKNTIYKFTNNTWVERRGIGKRADFQRLIFSLQGLMNRDFGMDADHTNAIFVTGDTSDTEWFNRMAVEGSIYGEMKIVNVRDWDKVKNTFLPIMKKTGMILWDGNVPATANVAATICGLDGYLPVLAESELHKTLEGLGVPVKMSLVGMFSDGFRGVANITGTNIKSTGSAKNDAYLWALEKYFHRCSSKYVAYTLDGAPNVKNYDAYEDNPMALLGDAGADCLNNHDYLIARRCFFFDLDPYKEQKACDDPAQKEGLALVGTDHATMIKIFERRYQRANGQFGFLMGFIPWWLKYTDHHNHSSKAGTWLEWMFCEIITCYNLSKEADAAHPCSMYNGSFMYKYIPRTKQYENNKKSESIMFDANTYYYTIYVGDYDSSAWLKKHIYDMWIARGGDKNRGNLPLMWSINPNLSDRIPVVFEYLFENKSDNDYFAGGDGGAGYVIPSALFHDRTLANYGAKRPSGNAAAGNLFAQFSKPYYNRFQMDITGFLINGNNGAINANIASCINQYSPVGSFVNDNVPGVSKYNGTYYVKCLTQLTEVSDSSYQMYTFAEKAKPRGVNFGAYRTICWTPSQIKSNTDSFATYASGKGMKVKYCDPYTYFNLLKQSGQGSNIG